MNIENAKKITGYTNERELLWLAERANACHGSIAEIGSWQGRSTRAMADNTSATIYAIDTWQGTPNEHDKILAGKETDWLFREFTKNIGEAHLANHVCPMQVPSLIAAKSFADVEIKFAMIFIDAAHDYENVKADILAWQPLLAPGGLFCGHDFDAGRPGVVKAVRELVKNPRMAQAGSIWVAG